MKKSGMLFGVLTAILFSCGNPSAEKENQDELVTEEAKVEQITEDIEESSENLNDATERTKDEVDSLLSEFE